MKKLFLIVIITGLIVISGCNKSTITSPNDKSNTTGKLTLQIDKTNAPQNVITVSAYLTRLNYDTLSSSLNLQSDSSADVSIQNIPSGEWHLTVNAMNDSNLVVYSGQTDVTITDGFTTQVSLTLVPVSNGTGSIFISVTWGTSVWADYYGNPIFTNYNNPNQPLGVTQGRVLYDNGIYKMWYINVYNSAVGTIGYAESNDGIHWHYPVNYPVLTHGQAGAWDDYSVGVGVVLKEGTGYKMYYNGFQDQYGVWDIGLATSSDGIHWTKYLNPVLTPSTLEHQIGVSSVINVNGKYYLYYTARNYPYYSIGVATSSDGINWTKIPGNPILSPDAVWEGTGVYSPSVIYDGGQFKMVYMNAAATGFGFAYSSDGINWQKDSNNPFFTPSMVTSKWTNGIAYPDFHKFGNHYSIYYTGYPNNNDVGVIGVIAK